MKRRFFRLLIAALLFVNINGCIGAIIVGGAAGALGGYAASRDTVQSETDKPYEAIWSSAVETATSRGTIEEEDVHGGYLKFKTEDESYVWVQLVRLTRATTRLKVSARRYHLPNLKLAEDVFVKILENIR